MCTPVPYTSRVNFFSTLPARDAQIQDKTSTNQYSLDPGP